MKYPGLTKESIGADGVCCFLAGMNRGTLTSPSIQEGVRSYVPAYSIISTVAIWLKPLLFVILRLLVRIIQKSYSGPTFHGSDSDIDHAITDQYCH